MVYPAIDRKPLLLQSFHQTSPRIYCLVAKWCRTVQSMSRKAKQNFTIMTQIKLNMFFIRKALEQGWVTFGLQAKWESSLLGFFFYLTGRNKKIHLREPSHNGEKSTLLKGNFAQPAGNEHFFLWAWSRVWTKNAIYIYIFFNFTFFFNPSFQKEMAEDRSTFWEIKF